MDRFKICSKLHLEPNVPAILYMEDILFSDKFGIERHLVIRPCQRVVTCDFCHRESDFNSSLPLCRFYSCCDYESSPDSGFEFV